jgi:hypothetical protein
VEDISIFRKRVERYSLRAFAELEARQRGDGRGGDQRGAGGGRGGRRGGGAEGREVEVVAGGDFDGGGRLQREAEAGRGEQLNGSALQSGEERWR